LYLKKTIVLFIFLAKNRGKTQKEQGSATDPSALLHHNARALAIQIVCYIPLYYYIIIAFIIALKADRLIIRIF
jgi:hypothetical protein